jgi:hypothetical protein
MASHCRGSENQKLHMSPSLSQCADVKVNLSDLSVTAELYGGACVSRFVHYEDDLFCVELA